MLSYFSRLASEKSGFIKIKYTIKSVSIRSYSDQNSVRGRTQVPRLLIIFQKKEKRWKNLKILGPWSKLDSIFFSHNIFGILKTNMCYQWMIPDLKRMFLVFQFSHIYSRYLSLYLGTPTYRIEFEWHILLFNITISFYTIKLLHYTCRVW